MVTESYIDRIKREREEERNRNNPSRPSYIDQYRTGTTGPTPVPQPSRPLQTDTLPRAVPTRRDSWLTRLLSGLDRPIFGESSPLPLGPAVTSPITRAVTNSWPVRETGGVASDFMRELDVFGEGVGYLQERVMLHGNEATYNRLLAKQQRGEPLSPDEEQFMAIAPEQIRLNKLKIADYEQASQTLGDAQSAQLQEGKWFGESEAVRGAKRDIQARFQDRPIGEQFVLGSVDPIVFMPFGDVADAARIARGARPGFMGARTARTAGMVDDIPYRNIAPEAVVRSIDDIFPPTTRGVDVPVQPLSPDLLEQYITDDFARYYQGAVPENRIAGMGDITSRRSTLGPANRQGLPEFRGDETDLYEMFIQMARQERLTEGPPVRGGLGDPPLFMPDPEDVPRVQRSVGQAPSSITDPIPGNAPLKTASEVAAEPAQIFEPTTAERHILGLREHTVGLTRGERINNALKRALGRPFREATSLVGRGMTEADPVVSPVMQRARQGVRNAESLGNVHRTTVRPMVDDVFEFNEYGQIPSLAGVEARRGAGPTIRTVAARYPIYRDSGKMTPEQIRIMDELRDIIEDPRQLYNQHPIVDVDGNIVRAMPAQAEDIVEGGFYLPAGSPEMGALDAPTSYANVRYGGTRTTTSAEHHRVFTGTPDGPTNVLTQEEAIEQLGARYPHPADAIGDFTVEAGRRAASVYIADALKPYGQTTKQIAAHIDPELFREMQTLRRDIDNLRGLGVRHSKKQSDTIHAFFDDPEFDDINAVYDVVSKPIQRGRFAGLNVQEAEALRKSIQARMSAIRPSYNRLMEKARNVKTINGEAVAGIPNHPLLRERKFPFVMADNAKEELQRMTGGTTRDIQHAADAWYVGTKATADDSALGIQTWIFAWNHPKRWLNMALSHWKAWFKPNVVASRIADYNSMSTRRIKVDGVEHILPTIEEAISAGVPITSGSSAPAALRGTTSAADKIFTGPGRVRIPFTQRRINANPLKRFNDTYNAAVDDIGMWAFRDDVVDKLREGRTIDDLWSSGDMYEIGHAIARDRGMPGNVFGGPLGKRFAFASRWLQARLEMAANGVISVKDPRILVEAMPYGSRLTQANRLTMSQRTSAKRFWRFMTYATALTVAINEFAEEYPDAAAALGLEVNPTYLQPRTGVDLKRGEFGRFNNNFMRIRFMGRDWSFYGPFHSLYNLLHLSATGRPHDALRGIAGGVPSNLWDLVGILTGQADFRSRSQLGEDIVAGTTERITGEEIDRNADTVEAKAIQIAGRMIENLTPFGAEEAYESGQVIGEGDIVGGSTGVYSEFFGIQSSEMSPSDIADRMALEHNLPTMNLAEPYQSRILYAFEDVEAKREGFPLTVNQARINGIYDGFDERVAEIVTMRLPPRDKASLYMDAEGDMYAALNALRTFEDKFDDPFAALENGEIQSEADALDGWYAIANMPGAINPRTGKPGGDNFYRLRRLYLSRLSPEYRDYVLRNSNIRVPPDIIMMGISSISPNKRRLLNDSIAARKRHLESIGASPDLADRLKVLP